MLKTKIGRVGISRGDRDSKWRPPMGASWIIFLKPPLILDGIFLCDVWSIVQSCRLPMRYFRNFAKAGLNLSQYMVATPESINSTESESSFAAIIQ